MNLQKSRKYYQWQRSEMEDFLPHQYSKVLEIGCSEGDFSRRLRKGAEIWGIEPDAKSAELASRVMKRVLIGKYEDVQDEIPNKYFDLVICNDVIEHMNDCDWFLESIRGKLHNSGFLVASIPNVRYLPNLYELLVLKDWRYREIGILDYTHVRFFTERSILRTLSANGFVIEKFRGINPIEKQLRGINPFKLFCVRLSLMALTAVTLGYYSDVRWRQFALRARQG